MNFNLLKNVNISSIIKSASGTLNVVKKIIPLYKEVRPFFSKEKTIFESKPIKKESIEEPKYNNSITFFQ